MGGAGIEGGAGDPILTSPHRSFGAVRKASTSAIVAPTYALGFPFSDAPAITAKVSCTAPAKPRARICQQVRARLNIGGRGHAERMPHLHRQPRGVDQALVGTDRGRGVDGHLVAAMDRALLPVGQQQHELAHAGATAFAQQVGTRVQRRGDGRGACRGAVEAQPVGGAPLVWEGLRGGRPARAGAPPPTSPWTWECRKTASSVMGERVLVRPSKAMTPTFADKLPRTNVSIASRAN